MREIKILLPDHFEKCSECPHVISLLQEVQESRPPAVKNVTSETIIQCIPHMSNDYAEIYLDFTLNKGSKVKQRNLLITCPVPVEERNTNQLQQSPTTLK